MAATPSSAVITKWLGIVILLISVVLLLDGTQFHGGIIRPALDDLSQSLSGPLSPEDEALREVLWDRVGIRSCVKRACLSKEPDVQSKMRWKQGDSKKYEENLAELIKQGWSYTALDPLRIRKAASRFRGKSCSIVGGAPFSGDALNRSRAIDAQDFVFRANFNIPFDKPAGDRKGMPAKNMTSPNPTLGLGTRSDVLVMNHVALRSANCFVLRDERPKLAEYFKSSFFIHLVHSRQQVQKYGQCLESIHDSGEDVHLVPLNPERRFDDYRLLQNGTTKAAPFATTGFTMLTTALQLCGSVHTFGFTGSTTQEIGSATYGISGFHKLNQERGMMKAIRDCEVLTEGGVCKKLKLLS